MSFRILVPLASAALVLAGCGAAITKDVSISLRYIPSGRAPAAAARIETVGLGAFTDARSGRPAGAAGERIKFDSHIARFRPRAGAPGGLARGGGKSRGDGPARPALARVWAGGDCATGGDDLTVTAGDEGRDAAESIHRTLGG